MRLSTATAIPVRTMRTHPVLTGLLLAVLAALVAFAAWFGPESAALGFTLWALASAPMVLAAWFRTRSRPLRTHAVLLLLTALGMPVFAQVLDRIETRSPALGAAFQILFTALPFLLTVEWLRRLHAAPARGVPVLRHAPVGWRAPAMAGVLALAGAGWWVHASVRWRPEEPASVARFAGCYEIRLGRWIPGAMSGHDVGGIVPARVHLDTVRGVALDTAARGADGPEERWGEVGRRLIRPGWWGHAYWVPVEGERVWLVWGTGFHGVGMELRAHRGELRGVATGFTDVVSWWPDPRARVRAVPVDCALVGPDNARLAWRPRT